MKEYLKPQVIASYNEADLIATDNDAVSAQQMRICFGAYCFTFSFPF